MSGYQNVVLELLKQILANLEKNKLMYEELSNAAHQAATDTELKQEGKYDTRAIEAGYLAGAQKKRYQELKSQYIELQNYILNYSDIRQDSSVIKAYSLVHLFNEDKGEKFWVFIMPHGGGDKIVFEAKEIKREVKIVSTQSPFGKSLLNLDKGESVEIKIGKKTDFYEVLDFYS